MKNLKIKSLIFLISILTILNSLAWIENAKTIDIVITKNFHYQRITLNRILAIKNIQERQTEMQKFINKKEKYYIEEQNKRTLIFEFLGSTTFISIICIIISLLELRKKNKNVC